MAKIDKKEMVSRAEGIPTKETLLMSELNRDNLDAAIQTKDGQQQEALLSEGEFVFSIPAIVALGEGDYDSGMQMLEQMHEELKTIGKGYMDQVNEQPYDTEAGLGQLAQLMQQ